MEGAETGSRGKMPRETTGETPAPNQLGVGVMVKPCEVSS
jgi:hypothetical protein